MGKESQSEIPNKVGANQNQVFEVEYLNPG